MNQLSDQTADEVQKLNKVVFDLIEETSRLKEQIISQENIIGQLENWQSPSQEQI